MPSRWYDGDPAFDPRPRKPEIIQEPDEQPSIEESYYGLPAQREQRREQRCVCPCKREASGPGFLDGCLPCENFPTQEDGLCDRCRVYLIERRELAAAGQNYTDSHPRVQHLKTHCHTITIDPGTSEDRSTPPMMREKIWHRLQDSLEEYWKGT